jgi:hypothetical protein
MKDMERRVEKLIADAAECDLIANLAAETDKQEAFRSLANQYRAMAAAIEAVMAQRLAS